MPYRQRCAPNAIASRKSYSDGAFSSTVVPSFVCIYISSTALCPHMDNIQGPVLHDTAFVHVYIYMYACACNSPKGPGSKDNNTSPDRYYLCYFYYYYY